MTFNASHGSVFAVQFVIPFRFRSRLFTPGSWLLTYSTANDRMALTDSEFRRLIRGVGWTRQ